MSKPINTIPIQQFIQQVKAAELNHQKEIKIDIQTAKALAYCMGELNAKLVEDYDTLLSKMQQNILNGITLQVDAGPL